MKKVLILLLLLPLLAIACKKENRNHEDEWKEVGPITVVNEMCVTNPSQAEEIGQAIRATMPCVDPDDISEYLDQQKSVEKIAAEARMQYFTAKNVNDHKPTLYVKNTGGLKTFKVRADDGYEWNVNVGNFTDYNGSTWNASFIACEKDGIPVYFNIVGL